MKGDGQCSSSPFEPFGDETEELDKDLSRPRQVSKVNGRFLRTQSIGSIWAGHKKKDHNSGRQGLTP